MLVAGSGNRFRGLIVSFLLNPGHLLDDDDVLLFHEDRLLVRGDKIFWRREEVADFLDPDSVLHLVTSPGNRVMATLVSARVAEQLDAEDHSLRSLLFNGAEHLLASAGLANQVIDWYNSHRYCGRCGAPTTPHARERALVCEPCGRHYFPRINPCIIVLVTRGDQILLASHARSKGEFYSCLAGFIEVGESAEQTIHREVAEEVGVKVHNIRYFGSQSWPFPSQLMLGFFADYLEGDIVPDQEEIERAGWFDVRDLPNHPSARISVAGELIQAYCRERLG